MSLSSPTSSSKMHTIHVAMEVAETFPADSCPKEDIVIFIGKNSICSFKYAKLLLLWRKLSFSTFAGKNVHFD